MRSETAKRIEYLERCVAEIDEQLTLLGPLARRFLRLRKNLDLAGVPYTEPITLNLRVSEWPRQHKFCCEIFGHRLLGMNIRWIV